MNGPIQTKALYEEVADRIRELIYHAELEPGEWVDEKALCERLGISRTPLREALKVLASEGLLVLQPRRGCQVRTLSREELEELFPVMAVLEGLCAREAVEKCSAADIARLDAMHAGLEAAAAAGDIDAYYEQNCEFHGEVYQLSGNRWLQRMVADLRKILRLARHRQLTRPGRLQESLQEHRRIMEAFHRREAAQAEQAMQEHLSRQRDVLRDLDPGAPGEAVGQEAPPGKVKSSKP